MLKRLTPLIFGFAGGALIAGSLENRLWYGYWGGNGLCLFLGILITVAALFIIAGIEDGEL